MGIEVILMRKWCVSLTFFLGISRSGLVFPNSAQGSNRRARLIPGTEHQTGTISSRLDLPFGQAPSRVLTQ